METVDMDVIIDAAVGASKEDGILVNISGLFPGDEDLYDTAYFLADKFIDIMLLHGFVGNNIHPDLCPLFLHN